jgi:hypothetical protein
MAEQDHDPNGENIPADSVETQPGVEEMTEYGRQQTSGDDELAAMLEYDPFDPQYAGDDSGDGQGADAPSQGDSGAGQDDGSVGQQADPNAQPSQPSGQEDPAQLRQQLDEALRYIHQLREGQGQAQGQQGAQPGQDGQMGANQQGQDGQQEPLPNYQFQIPDQLLQMMDSDDPAQRKQALTYLGQGVAQSVHQMVRQEMAQKMGRMQQELPQTIQQQQAAQAQQKQIFDDFYGTYQDLNRPELRPTIVEVAKAVAGEYQQRGVPVSWGPEFKQAVANRVYQVLGRQPGQQPAAQPQQPQRQPSQPRNFGGNARRGVGQADSEQADIERTLFG